MTKTILFAALLGSVLFAQAAEPKVAKDAIAALEGVYKYRFGNVTMEPGRELQVYESEDIVEIVRYDDSHVYVRAHLEFPHDQMCAISGIAGYENGMFVFHDPKPSRDGAPPCTLSVGAVGDKLVLTDRINDGVSTCRAYCGERVSLSEITMPLSKRRSIRYLDRLKTSRQYIKAARDLQLYQLQKSDPSYTPEQVQRRHQE
ncbi:MAG TPA: hypothetical protein VFT37_05745 [Telluria sp.]|nr:hypothetical protein [Telluria sp.]